MGFTAEQRLLLDCASLETDAARMGRIRAAVEAGVDWRLLAEWADRHRVTLLLARRIEEICPAALEEPDAKILKHRCRLVARNNLKLTRELLAILALFERHGIATVPLKGPVLAVAAFGSLSLREFADLDVLVRADQLEAACALIQAAGYVPEYDLPPRRKASYIRWQHAFTFHRAHDDITIEIHWRLHDRYLSFPLTEKALWSGVRTEEMFGGAIRRLKPEHDFLFLCMHGAKHYWERIEWIGCLNALARTIPSERWPGMIGEANRLRCRRLLHLGLLLADNLSACDATRRGLELLEPDPAVNALAATVWRHVFAAEIEGASKEVYRLRFYLKAREHLLDRVKLIWSSSVRIPHPESSTWDESPLPDFLSFLYYVLRPLNLLKKFGLRGLRGVLRT